MKTIELFETVMPLETIQKLTLREIEQLLNVPDSVTKVVFPDKSKLVYQVAVAESYLVDTEMKVIQISYSVFDPDSEEHYLTDHEIFPVKSKKSALGYFVGFLIGTNPNKNKRIPRTNSLSLWEIAVITKDTLHTGSHYDYLDHVFDRIVQKVTHGAIPESSYGGMVVAHGDKVRQYWDTLQIAGINKYHASVMCLLTYIIMKDYPRHRLCEWVIEKYPLLVNHITDVEKDVFLEIKSRVSSH